MLSQNLRIKSTTQNPQYSVKQTLSAKAVCFDYKHISLKCLGLNNSTMLSKEILGNYLDKDLFDAVGEKSIEKIIRSNSNLSDTEIKLLALILQRKHDTKSMERVRDDISNVNLVHTAELDSNDQPNVSEVSVHDMISKLSKLNENLQLTINDLEDKKGKLANDIESLMSKTVFQSHTLDCTSITEDIHKAIQKSI